MSLHIDLKACGLSELVMFAAPDPHDPPDTAPTFRTVIELEDTPVSRGNLTTGAGGTKNSGLEESAHPRD